MTQVCNDLCRHIRNGAWDLSCTTIKPIHTVPICPHVFHLFTILSSHHLDTTLINSLPALPQLHSVLHTWSLSLLLWTQEGSGFPDGAPVPCTIAKCFLVLWGQRALTEHVLCCLSWTGYVPLLIYLSIKEGCS